MTDTITVQDLDDIFKDRLGQSFRSSLTDEGGCSMGRTTGVWMCPKLITKIVQDVLDGVGVDIEPYDADEPEEEDL